MANFVVLIYFSAEKSNKRKKGSSSVISPKKQPKQKGGKRGSFTAIRTSSATRSADHTKRSATKSRSPETAMREKSYKESQLERADDGLTNLLGIATGDTMLLELEGAVKSEVSHDAEENVHVESEHKESNELDHSVPFKRANRTMDRNAQLIWELLSQSQPYHDHSYTTVFGKKKVGASNMEELNNAEQLEDEDRPSARTGALKTACSSPPDMFSTDSGHVLPVIMTAPKSSTDKLHIPVVRIECPNVENDSLMDQEGVPEDTAKEVEEIAQDYYSE